MPEVTHVKHARKKNPVAEIGEPYYWWKFAFSGKSYSKTYPRQSQLTQSDFFISLFGAQEAATEALGGVSDAPSGAVEFDDQIANLESIKDSLVADLEGLRDETQEKFDNQPQGLQDGDTGQLLQGRVDSVEEMLEPLEQLEFQTSGDVARDDYESTIEDLVSALEVEYEGE